MKPQTTHLRCWLVLFSLAASLQITLGYYDPAAQRWLNRDPLGDARATLMFQAGPKLLVWEFIRGMKIEQYEGANLFAFLANNPLTLVDPFGRDHYQEPRFTKPGGITPGNVGPDMWKDLWNCIPPKYQGKICRAACWAAGGACTGLCPETGPGMFACLAACGVAASACADACPP